MVCLLSSTCGLAAPPDCAAPGSRNDYGDAGTGAATLGKPMCGGSRVTPTSVIPSQESAMRPNAIKNDVLAGKPIAGAMVFEFF
jgi:hypothetical protein